MKLTCRFFGDKLYRTVLKENEYNMMVEAIEKAPDPIIQMNTEAAYAG